MFYNCIIAATDNQSKCNISSATHFTYAITSLDNKFRAHDLVILLTGSLKLGFHKLCAVCVCDCEIAYIMQFNNQFIFYKTLEYQKIIIWRLIYKLTKHDMKKASLFDGKYTSTLQHTLAANNSMIQRFRLVYSNHWIAVSHIPRRITKIRMQHAYEITRSSYVGYILTFSYQLYENPSSFSSFLFLECNDKLHIIWYTWSEKLL